ncbi:MAG: hypothetical protein II366_00565 [Clostridia bacterium]|nr:hypothetical protein [Clostridia bacterium]
MKKTIGTLLTLAAFPMMCIGGDYEIMFKLAAVAMFGIGAWMADLFDEPKSNEEKKSELRLAHDDGDFKMPEE